LYCHGPAAAVYKPNIRKDKYALQLAGTMPLSYVHFVASHYIQCNHRTYALAVALQLTGQCIGVGGGIAHLLGPGLCCVVWETGLGLLIPAFVFHGITVALAKLQAWSQSFYRQRNGRL
jgi:hypothetical protein